MWKLIFLIPIGLIAICVIYDVLLPKYYPSFLLSKGGKAVYKTLKNYSWHRPQQQPPVVSDRVLDIYYHSDDDKYRIHFHLISSQKGQSRSHALYKKNILDISTLIGEEKYEVIVDFHKEGSDALQLILKQLDDAERKVRQKQYALEKKQALATLKTSLK